MVGQRNLRACKFDGNEISIAVGPLMGALMIIGGSQSLEEAFIREIHKLGFAV